MPAERGEGTAGRAGGRIGGVAALVFLASAVLAFTGGWAEGRLTIDGPGVSLWVRLLLRYWEAGHGVPSWVPDMWAGTPAFALIPAFQLLILLPVASALGPDEAVKISVVGAQVAGAWGAYVLARSLWSRGWPAVAAGLFYGLHPLFPSTGALAGHGPYVWVFAATPWLAWALRLGLRGQGSRYVVLAGLLVGFVLLAQAELAYSLVLLCGLLVAIEVARCWRDRPRRSAAGRVLLRATAVVAIGLGTAAHWLVPFLAMSRSFVLTPPEDVEVGLELLSGALSRDPGAFVHRAAGLGPTYDLQTFIEEWVSMEGVAAGTFYLGWVCLALTLVTVGRLGLRRGDDGTLSAVLLASAAGIWVSLGTVPLASGGLAKGAHLPTLLLVGAVAGLLVGNFLYRLGLRRAFAPATVAAALLLFVAPLVTPVSVVQRLVPFLASIRVPRLYSLAALGVALGAAYALILLRSWIFRRSARAPLVYASLSLVVAVAFVVDVHPYRSFYRIGPPDGTVAYGRAARVVSASADDSRVALDQPNNAQPIRALLDTGRELSVGWPHPIASKQLWRLTMDAMAGPSGYRDAALGLSGTAYLASERLAEGGRTVDELQLEPNTKVLPVVRTYEQVVVGDESIAPELAVSLSGRYTGVVAGGEDEVEELRRAGTDVLGSAGPCDAAARRDETQVAGEAAMACALHAWIGVRGSEGNVPVGSGVGAAFRSPIDGLRGVAVWLDRAPGRTELVLYQLSPDGVSVGPEVRRTQASDFDDNGMARYSFERISDSAGARYLFLLSCAGCSREERPHVLVTGEPRGPGALVTEDQVDPGRTANFSPVYDQVPPAPPPAPDVRATRRGPGKWHVEVSGERPSLLVVAESYFPGWTATVDGRRSRVMEADGAFLGVALGAGRHEVTLEYGRQPAVPVGLAVTALTLVASGAALVVSGRAGRPSSSSLSRRRPRVGPDPLR